MAKKSKRQHARRRAEAALRRAARREEERYARRAATVVRHRVPGGEWALVSLGHEDGCEVCVALARGDVAGAIRALTKREGETSASEKSEAADPLQRATASDNSARCLGREAL